MMHKALSVMTLVLLGSVPWRAAAEDAKKPESESAPVEGSTSPTRGMGLLGDETGLDLVVSKVRLTRGDYPQGKVQVTSYVKNMCNGSTREIIKVYYRELGTALFVHGIGPKEEKSAGSVYFCSSSDCALGPFEAIVDQGNAIGEHNETNNTCANIRLEATQRSKTVSCPIPSYTCGRGHEIGKYRSRQTRTR
jgi:hypothetical protein